MGGGDRRRQRREGPRRPDGGRAERDVPHPRRGLQQARGRRERAQRRARDRHLHLRPSPAGPAQPRRGRHRRDLRPRDRERDPGHRHQAGLHQVRRRRAGRHPNVEKVHRAAARAAKQTGKPIMAHSHPASGTGLEQMRIFGEEGVDPATVHVAHTGDTDDLDYIERLLETGCWIGMDRYGLDIFLPTEKRNATVLALLERGYAERMFLSQDFCSSIDWFPREVQEYLKANEVPDWSMTFLFEQVIPALICSFTTTNATTEKV